MVRIEDEPTWVTTRDAHAYVETRLDATHPPSQFREGKIRERGGSLRRWLFEAVAKAARSNPEI